MFFQWKDITVFKTTLVPPYNVVITPWIVRVQLLRYSKFCTCQYLLPADALDSPHNRSRLTVELHWQLPQKQVPCPLHTLLSGSWGSLQGKQWKNPKTSFQLVPLSKITIQLTHILCLVGRWSVDTHTPHLPCNMVGVMWRSCDTHMHNTQTACGGVPLVVVAHTGRALQPSLLAAHLTVIHLQYEKSWLDPNFCVQYYKIGQF